MARKKISEYKAKQLLSPLVKDPKPGLCYLASENLQIMIQSLDKTAFYVVKVDQGVKGRFKKGLVAINKMAKEIERNIEDWQKKGYRQFFIEPYIAHENKQEKYLSLERVREGYMLLFSEQGGVDIEQHPEKIVKKIISRKERLQQIEIPSLPKNLLAKLIDLFDQYYFSFLEINPLLVRKDSLFFLDAAVEVDSAAESMVKGAWTSADFRESKPKTTQEENILKLAENSQSAFNLTVLNPNGSLFMILSGGGASIALADEAYNQGLGREVANYGEYSGNPTEEESYIYAKNLLDLLLVSSAKKKALVIGGGVANFTDVRITFRGILKALEEVKNMLQKQNVKIFVRRGGPNQEEGLSLMRDFLGREELLGVVWGPEKVLTDVVLEALQYLR